MRIFIQSIYQICFFWFYSIVIRNIIKFIESMFLRFLNRHLKRHGLQSINAGNPKPARGLPQDPVPPNVPSQRGLLPAGRPSHARLFFFKIQTTLINSLLFGIDHSSNTIIDGRDQSLLVSSLNLFWIKQVIK